MHADDRAGRGTFGHGIGAAVAVGRLGRRDVADIDGEGLRAAQSADGRLRGDAVAAAAGFEVDEIGVRPDRDDAHQGIDLEAPARAVGQRIGRERAVRIGREDGDAHQRSVRIALEHEVSGAIVVDRNRGRRVEHRDGEVLRRGDDRPDGRAPGDREGVRGAAALEIQQGAARDRHHAGRGIDRKAAAGGVGQLIGDGRAVRLVGEQGDADRAAVGGAFRHRIGRGIAVDRRRRHDVGDVDLEILRAGQRAVLRLHRDDVAVRRAAGLEIELRAVGNRHHAGRRIDGKTAARRIARDRECEQRRDPAAPVDVDAGAGAYRRALGQDAGAGRTGDRQGERRAPLVNAVVEKMNERIGVRGSNVGIGEQICARIEGRRRVAPLLPAELQEMHERVYAGSGDVGVGRQIAAHVEPGARVASFLPAEGQEVLERVDAGCLDIRILQEIEGVVEPARPEDREVRHVGCTALVATEREKVLERIDAARRHVRIVLQILEAVESDRRKPSLLPAECMEVFERIDARCRHVRIGHEIELGVEERARIEPLLPAELGEVRFSIDVCGPEVVIARIVEEVVNEGVAVVLVHRAVGEHVSLNAGQLGMAGRRVDDDAWRRIADGRVDQPEVEGDGVDAAETIDPGASRRRIECVVARPAVLDRITRIEGFLAENAHSGALPIGCPCSFPGGSLVNLELLTAPVRAHL